MQTYTVGTRDTEGIYRRVTVKAETVLEANVAAINTLEAKGVQAVAVSCRATRP